MLMSNFSVLGVKKNKLLQLQKKEKLLKYGQVTVKATSIIAKELLKWNNIYALLTNLCC